MPDYVNRGDFYPRFSPDIENGPICSIFHMQNFDSIKDGLLEVWPANYQALSTPNRRLRI